MNNIKLNKKNILIVLVIVIILCVAFLVCLVSEYINLKNDVANIDDVPHKVNLSFDNNMGKYHNETIETINYLAGYMHEYVYNDIHFLSSIDGWNEKKLEEVAKELFQNKHGEEIKYVEAVILSQGDGMYCYGNQEQIYAYYDTPISLYNFLHKDSIYYIASEKSKLYVDNVSELLSVEDIAQALSVAYGHHYVNYYMNLKGTEEDKETKFYRLRGDGIEEIKVEFIDNQDYLDNYMWALVDIAAYDYMYLMGSVNANRIFDSFEGGKYRVDSFDEAYLSIKNRYRNARNITPHINVNIVLPDRVEGLSEYFYSFIDEEATKQNSFQPLDDIEFNLSYEDYYNYRKFEISWEVPFEDADVFYTIVKYNMNDEAEVAQGFATGSEGSSIKIDAMRSFQLRNTRYSYSMKTDQEFKIRIIATFPDGSISISEPFIIKYPDEFWTE